MAERYDRVEKEKGAILETDRKKNRNGREREIGRNRQTDRQRHS